jgi:gamma-glutamylcyclotransferase (GGCT)/AIG2-like uncharacterized protein YtfP
MAKPVSSEHLFVYGTLRPPSPIPLAARLSVVAAGSVAGRLYDFGEYPGLVETREDNQRVQGLICALPADGDMLARLDDYEGYEPQRPHGSLFVRRRGEALTNDGRRLSCWVYYYNRPLQNQPHLLDGVWPGEPSQ